MAILGNITAEVLVDGKALQEYEVDGMEKENPDLVVKYIEATSGAAFAIKVSVSEPYKIDSDSLAFQIFLDGNHSLTKLMTKAKYGRKDRSWKKTIAGVTRNGRNDAELKPFMFSEITRVDTASMRARIESPSALEDMGTIKLKVHRKHVIKTCQVQEHDSSPFDINGVSEMTENKLKGTSVTHTYRLGEKQSTKKPLNMSQNTWTMKTTPSQFSNSDIVQKGLQDMLLIPRTPTPVPLDERPLEELGVEELRELARRQKALIKPEHKREEQLKPERGIKRERDEEYEELLASAQAKKVKVNRPFAYGEVVDLDDD